MFPILYENVTAGVVPQHKGLGTLSDCVSCTVEQVRNDIYELTMEYPINGIHAQDIAYRRVLKVKPNPTDDPQLFRISRVGKTMNGTFMVYAKHISYDLSGYPINGGTANNATAACALFQSAAPGYTITTDKVVTANFKINTPGSVKSYFVGREGSFLDVFGSADIKYDNFNVQFLLHAGQDRGETIRYGKNLLELSQEIDASNLYTHVECYYKNGDSDAVVGNRVSTGLPLDVSRTLVLDVSSEYEEAPTVSALTARAQRYINENNLTTPANNVKLDFVQSGELAHRVDLCDTVSIYYEAIGLTRTQMKCIRTKYDCIREKYIETEFGDARTSAVDTIAANNMKLVNTPSTSFMAEAIARATELITGNLGGNVVIHKNSEGRPFEILIMDTDDINTAVKLWRWGLGGFGYSKTGYDGPYGTAITMNGQIVADYIATGTLDASKITVQKLSASSITTGTLDGTKATISNINASNINSGALNADLITTGTLNANLIKAGTISDTQGNSSIDMTNGVAKMTNFDAKARFRLLSSAGVEKVRLAHNVGAGSNFTFFNESGVDCGGLASSSGGLVVVVNNGNGKHVAQIEPNTNGGAFFIANNSGETRGVFHATEHGARIYVTNNSGTQVGYMNANSAQGGTMALANSAATVTITCSGDSGNVRCVSLTQTSSRKVKKNIKPIEDAEKILELQAVSFDYKEKLQGTDKRGFVAEDVAKVLPNLVTPETEDTPATLDYIGMIPYLQAVIKEQEKRIQALEKRLDALEQ